MSRHLAACALIALGSTSTHAQTCEQPLIIPWNMTTGGSTCDAENTLPNFGPLPSPHRDAVYWFYGEPHLDDAVLHLNGDFEAAAILLPATCSALTDPVAAVAFGTSGQGLLSLDGLPSGDYFLVITGDPESPKETCGYFEITPEPLFHVDPIFHSDFELLDFQ